MTTGDLGTSVTLDGIARREAEIFSVVEQATGDMEQKYAALAAAGVFDAYADVLARYVDQLDSSALGLEALKRAVFLVWYDLAEPGCFTGLRDLPEPQVRDVLNRLDAAVGRGLLDSEFEAMLGHYHTIADHAFTRSGSRPALERWLSASDPDAWRTQVPVPSDRWSRGQMSAYWTSVTLVT